MRPLTNENNQLGFPADYYRRQRRIRAGAIGVLATSIAGICCLVWGAIVRDAPLLEVAAGTAVLLYLTAVAVAGLRDLRTLHQCARIVPYFENKLPGADTFFKSGHLLARNCAHLDEIAVQAGLAPLSVFGFEDNFSFLGERPAWREAEQGLETVAGLLRILSEHPDLLQEAAGVIADLNRIEAKLKEACRLQVRFCLHLRMGSYSSGQEFDQRRGRYF